MKQVFILKEGNKSITSATDLFKNIKKFNIDYSQENFIVFYCNSMNEIIKSEVLFKGGLNCIHIDPKTIFRNALLNNASCLFVAHNHPSEDLTPSNNDLMVSKKLKELGEKLSLKVLDSLIFNKDKFYSMGL